MIRGAAASSKRVLVGLHPREDRTLWDEYEISDVATVQASARAEAAIGIPGTVFPLIAAVGTPLVGCTDPALSVPDYLLSVCSATIGAAADAAAVAGARLPDAATLADAIGHGLGWAVPPAGGPGCASSLSRPHCAPAPPTAKPTSAGHPPSPTPSRHSSRYPVIGMCGCCANRSQLCGVGVQASGCSGLFDQAAPPLAASKPLCNRLT
ncbi:hypothetical protein [Spirillospora sp. CA-294931]|uniref:hypothetical protein n=1 Tax=Spirillospora sp. CA-294931 TaxID=3240042 RepID=UPI003D8ABA23